MRTVLARAFSTLGHPVVVAPVAGIAVAQQSSLELQRHSRVEVIVAMLLGLLAGCAYHAGVVALHR